ncbi:MAG: prepilin-type N-terminal cleavage/methylation domain-containing protein [Phycisphaeraceae bacterium]
MHKRHAFTLIEMLLVVSIIVLLIAILLPALGASRENAQEVLCRTRLKAMYEGHVSYSVSNFSRFPHYNTWLWTGAKSGIPSEQWAEYGNIWQYVKDREMYFCPKDDKRREPGSSSIGGGGGQGNNPIHSYVRMMEPRLQFKNRLVSGGMADADATRVADYLSPRSMKSGCFMPLPGSSLPASAWAGAPRSIANVALMFEEATMNSDSVAQGTSSVLLNDGHSYFSFQQDQMSTRHQGNAHIQYWDGHCAKVNAKYFNDWPWDHNPQAERFTFGVE